MAGKQEAIRDVARTVLQDPRDMVKADSLKPSYQEVSARPTGKTSETGTSSICEFITLTGNSVKGLKHASDNPRN